MRLINRKPGRSGNLMLASLPFVLLIAAYLVASHLRLEANPGDKLLPAPQSFVAAMQQMALEADARTGQRLLWQDTWASLRRLLLGLDQDPQRACRGRVLQCGSNRIGTAGSLPRAHGQSVQQTHSVPLPPAHVRALRVQAPWCAVGVEG